MSKNLSNLYWDAKLVKELSNSATKRINKYNTETKVILNEIMLEALKGMSGYYIDTKYAKYKNLKETKKDLESLGYIMEQKKNGFWIYW